MLYNKGLIWVKTQQDRNFTENLKDVLKQRRGVWVCINVALFYCEIEDSSAAVDDLTHGFIVCYSKRWIQQFSGIQ